MSASVLAAAIAPVSAAVEPQAFEVQPTSAALGADIVGLDLTQELHPATIQALQQAWNQHLVLRFRGQHKLTVQDHICFSAYFGKLDQRPIGSQPLHASTEALPREIVVISNVVQDGKALGGLGDGESVWHADMTYQPVPPKAALLLAREIPAAGGNTYFANMYAAFDTLPPDLKAKALQYDCVHDASRNSAGQLRLGFKDTTDPRETVGAVHPLARLNPETGRYSLYLGRRRGAYVRGLPLDESEALLNALWAHATQQQFAWAQQWQVGDLVAWDNRVTLHRRDAFDPSARRYMQRTQVSE